MTPTEPGNAFSTMTFSQSDDAWYMDFGATSHITHSSSSLLPLFKLTTKIHILVGNGNHIPIIGYGHTFLPNQRIVL